MFSANHCRTVNEFPDSASLQGNILPQVIAPNDNRPLDKFVRNVEDRSRHNALHWMGKPISFDIDSDVKDPL